MSFNCRQLQIFLCTAAAWPNVASILSMGVQTFMAKGHIRNCGSVNGTAVSGTPEGLNCFVHGTAVSGTPEGLNCFVIVMLYTLFTYYIPNLQTQPKNRILQLGWPWVRDPLRVLQCTEHQQVSPWPVNLLNSPPTAVPSWRMLQLLLHFL
jgi:hypothetical protein